MSLKQVRTDPYIVQHWTGKQFQLQCWTDSPLKVSALSCLLVHLPYADDQPFWRSWIHLCHCKPAIFEKSQIKSDQLLLQWLKGHLDNLLSQGFSHLSVACHLAISKCKECCQLNRVCHLIKEIIIRCQINTNYFEVSVFSNFDEFFFQTLI